MRSGSKARSEIAICAALFLAAASVRLLFLAATVDRGLPFSIFYYGDSRIYREFALALLRGDVFDQGIPFHPPGFAFLLSWLIGWLGERPGAIRAALSIFGATAAPMTYLLGKALWGRAVGFTAAILATFSFGLCVLSVSPNAESIYIPLLLAQALLLVGLGDALASGRTRTARILVAASGIVLGFGALTRAEHLGFAAILPAALAWGWPSIPRRRIALCGTIMAGTALVLVAPWTIRNHEALTRFNVEHHGLAEPLPTWVGVTSTVPLNFAIANNSRADGMFRSDSAVATMGQGRVDFSDPAQADLYLHGFRRGWAFLVGDPAAAGTLLARKLALASDAYALGFGLSNWPGGLTGTRRPVDVFTPDRRIWEPVALILLAAGIWISRPVLRRAAILWLAGLFGVAVVLASFGYARFFLQAAPFVFLFEAAALVALVGRLRSAGARRAVAWAGCALAIALMVELAVGASYPRNFRASGSMDAATGKLVQDAALEIEPVAR